MREGQTRARERLKALLIYILLGYVAALALVRIFESRLIFFPNYPARLDGDWHPRSLPVEDSWLTTSDGVTLHAWWIPNPRATFTFLAFHGNASNIANRTPVYEMLWGLPANVLAVEYRGYGRSEGNPSEVGLYRDADAAYGYLLSTKGVHPHQVISFGQSLGTAVAAHLAAQHEVAGVVLEAPFPSASRVARQTFWFLPGLSVLVHSQFNTLARLAQVRAPLLVIHCRQDPVLPFKFGEEVYNAAPSPKEFLSIDGPCHEEASVMAPNSYRAALQRFLKQIETKR